MRNRPSPTYSDETPEERAAGIKMVLELERTIRPDYTEREARESWNEWSDEDKENVRARWRETFGDEWTRLDGQRIIDPFT